MAPKRIDTPALNDREALTRMYDKYTLPEIAERLGCSLGTVRSRFKEFGIETRSGASSSFQTRIEKAEMVIRNLLHEFDRPIQVMILKPIVKDLGFKADRDKSICPICHGVDRRHEEWCSMATRKRG